MLAMDDIGRDAATASSSTQDDRPIELAFKLYPWEWMLRETFGASLAGRVDPLGRAALEGDPVEQRHPAAAVGDVPAPSQPAAGLFRRRSGGCPARRARIVRKPLYSREGANVEIVVGGEAIDADGGPYGAEGFVRQAVAPLPQFDGNYAVLGSWIAAGVPCGLSVREDASPITKNTSRFLPHAIID